uniref:Uncharacterized protein n=1 Tax=Rhizophora mucronata TaxID=61149 RepID=A0A2P2PL01_RHIMU
MLKYRPRFDTLNTTVLHFLSQPIIKGKKIIENLISFFFP